MIHEQLELNGRPINAYVIPCGPFNVVFADTGTGMIGCGAFDVAALDKFSYPAVKMAGAEGASIITVDDLLKGTVKEVNVAAQQKGIEIGQNGQTALEKM
ncbi:MAG: DUF1805 domain-containing protein [Chitinivibrionales bacterium]|nr:DUF1805 domain-containing protein [Chitinivibrionales bacterium]